MRLLWLRNIFYTVIVSLDSFILFIIIRVSSYSFDLSKPISIKEAIFALDYIDHDFYVFRDEESNEVSVVYKRNAGGVGLIQPEQ